MVPLIEFLGDVFIGLAVIAILPFYLAWLGLGWCADRIEGRACHD